MAVKLDKGTAQSHLQAVISTVVWAVFLIAGAFASLQLRGDISLKAEASSLVGSVLAAFVVFALISIVYKANFTKPEVSKPVAVKPIKK
jgi:uncharacterized membrane protein